MKKTYIAPQTTSFIVNAYHMICESLNLGGKASENSVTSGDSKDSGNWNLWDDDDEE